MKPLIVLTRTQKAKILFDLISEEIPKFLEHLIKACTEYRTCEKNIRKDWNNGFFTVDLWYRLITDAECIIKKHRFSMVKSSQVFADQLFYGETGAFTIHCLLDYGKHNCTYTKFKLAIQLFFT